MDVDVVCPGVDCAGSKSVDHVLAFATAQVTQQLRDHHVVRAASRAIPDPMQDLVRSVTGGADRQPDLGACRPEPVAQFHEPPHAGFVVRVVDDDRAPVELEQVRPSGVPLGIEDE
jgi:hypothetical protein